jgi:hypothetical protein
MANFLLVLDDCMAALHARKYAIGTVLHRQVKKTDEFRHFRIGLNQAVGELDRMRGRKPDSVDAIDSSDVIYKRSKIGNLN